MKNLIIDSGTSTCRVRLTYEDMVLDSVSRKVGAKDVAITGCNKILKIAIKECIDEVLINNELTIEDIDGLIACGMISSNMGLFEVVHLSSPVGLKEIAGNLTKKYFSEIVHKSILFIPGIKTGFTREHTLNNIDIMRGEETEIIGYMEYDKESILEDTLFFHYGSHNKCILVKNGKIVESRTNITGELMMTISQNTILKSSLLPIDKVVSDMHWVKRGLADSEKFGFARALFLVRILDTIEKKTKQEQTSYFLGILISQDLTLISELVSQNSKRIVIYGKELFPTIISCIIKERYPHLKIITVSDKQADFLSIKGAVKIYKEFLKEE